MRPSSLGGRCTCRRVEVAIRRPTRRDISRRRCRAPGPRRLAGAAVRVARILLRGDAAAGAAGAGNWGESGVHKAGHLRPASAPGASLGAGARAVSLDAPSRYPSMDAARFTRIAKALADPRRFEILQTIAAGEETPC